MPTAPLQYATHDDVRIAYLDHGGGVTPLLLVPGLGGGRNSYPTGFVAALSDVGFHVVSYDPRDIGASTRFTGTMPPSPLRSLLGAGSPAYTAEDLADDAVAVLDALDWSRASVFGMSNGGLVAQRIALRHPDRVLGVTSMSSTSSDASGLSGLRHLHLGFVVAAGRLDHPDTPEGDVETALDVARLCASPGYPFDEAALRTAFAEAPPDGVRDTDAQGRHLRAPWHGPRLRDLQVPLLVLHGDRDPVVRPSAACSIARAAPRAELGILPGLGHDLPEPLWPHLAERVRRHAAA